MCNSGAETIMVKINVRWWDGYLETFGAEASSIRAGAYLLYFRQIDGTERRIPLNQVRWYSIDSSASKL